jgi:hypothetical protein
MKIQMMIIRITSFASCFVLISCLSVTNKEDSACEIQYLRKNLMEECLINRTGFGFDWKNVIHDSTSMKNYTKIDYFTKEFSLGKLFNHRIKLNEEILLIEDYYYCKDTLYAYDAVLRSDSKEELIKFVNFQITEDIIREIIKNDKYVDTTFNLQNLKKLRYKKVKSNLGNNSWQISLSYNNCSSCKSRF